MGKQPRPISERELWYWTYYLEVRPGKDPAAAREGFLVYMAGVHKAAAEDLGFIDAYYASLDPADLVVVATRLYGTYGSAYSPYVH